MKVPSEYLDDLLKPDALKDKGARAELGRHLDALRGDADDLLQRLGNFLSGITVRTWTPSLRQGVNITTSSIYYARYQIVGKMVKATMRMTAGSAGTAGQVIYIDGLPKPAAIASIPVGVVWIYNGTNYVGAAFPNGNSVFGIVDGYANNLGITPAVTLAGTNAVGCTVEYEMA